MANNKRLICFILLLFLFNIQYAVSGIEPVENNQETIKVESINIKTASKPAYNIQKYTGFNFLIDYLAEGILKGSIKLKTHAKKISVDLRIYSGWDLLRKKAKSLDINADKLYLEDIPIENFSLITQDPIYFKKNKKKKNQAVIPLGINSKLTINLDNITNILNSLPKWQKVFGELELPVPPFGYTKVKLSDLSINVSDDGLVKVSTLITSLENQDSEPINISFVGNLRLVEKAIVVNNLQSEMEEIFTKDSEMGMSFSTFLEDLINPIFDFSKYEKNNLLVESVKITFEKNNLMLDINLKLTPELEEGI